MGEKAAVAEFKKQPPFGPTTNDVLSIKDTQMNKLIEITMIDTLLPIDEENKDFAQNTRDAHKSEDIGKIPLIQLID